jgi:hypothetical protein
MSMPYAGPLTAGSKSFAKCGSIEPPTTPSSIIEINSNTAPGSFSFSNPNHYFPLKTDRTSLARPGSAFEEHYTAGCDVRFA